MAKKVIKLIFFLFLFAFLGAYLIEKTGYYEYNLGKKKNVTEEEIKRFEEDVKNGEDMDLSKYLEDTVVDYSSPLTRSTTRVSLKVNGYLKTFLSDGFKVFMRFVK